MTHYTLAAAVALLGAPAFATDYYVAPPPAGSDSNTGTSAAPFATIQKAADTANAGDTVLIRAGTYRESVVFTKSGAAGNPITFKPDGSARVVLTGLNVTTGTWTRESGSIYKTTLPPASASEQGSQFVFIDGTAQTIASFPNLTEAVDFDWTNWAGADTASAGATATYTDAALPSLTTAQLNGAKVTYVPQVGSTPYTGTVTGISGKTLSFTPDARADSNKQPHRGDPYLLWNALALLDQAGEAFLDTSGAAPVLYIWSPGGGDPGGNVVEYRARDSALIVNAASHVVVEGLYLLAANVRIGSAASNITLDGLTMQYGGTSLDKTGAAQAILLTQGTGCRIVNCKITDSYGGCLEFRGSGQTIENNVVANGHEHNISGWTASGGTVRNNTIYRSGGRNINVNSSSTDYTYNHVYHGGLSMTDQGAINCRFAGDMGASVFAYNWIHSNLGRVNPGLEWLGGRGLRFNGRESNYQAHHNIIWNLSSRAGLTAWAVESGEANFGDAKVKIYNNTVLADATIQNTGGRTANLTGLDFQNNIWLNLTQSTRGINQGAAVVRNNIFLKVDPATDWPDNNRQFGINFVSGATGNFYPDGSSAALNSGNNLGAFNAANVTGGAPEHGALEYVSANGKPWMAGAFITADHLAALDVEAVSSPSGTAYFRVSGLPVGRILPDAFAIKIGSQPASSDFRIVYDTENHLAQGYFTVNTGALSGSQPVQWALDGSSFVNSGKTVTVGGSSGAGITVASVSPPTTSAAGGTTHSLTGSGFSGGGDFMIPVTARATEQSDFNSIPVPCVVDTATPIAAGNMKADGGDIRFLRWPDSVPFDHWVESGLGGRTTVIWAKHESNMLEKRFSQLDESTFYLTHGNTALTSESDKAVVTSSYPGLIDPSLKLWLNANAISGVAPGATLGTWPDLSDNGKDGVNANPVNQPVFNTNRYGGLPAVNFASSDWLECGTLDPVIASNMSFILIANPAVGGDPQGRMLSGNRADKEHWSRQPDTAVDWTTFSVRRLGKGTERFTLGRRAGQNNRYFTGEIAEVIFWNKNVDSDTFNEMRSYFNRKYGIENEPRGVGDTSQTIAPLSVTVGGTAATNVVVVSPTEIRFVAPPHPTGTTQTIVVTQGGSTQTLASGIQYGGVVVAPSKVVLTRVSFNAAAFDVTAASLDAAKTYLLRRSVDGTSFVSVGAPVTGATTATFTDPSPPAGQALYQIWTSP